MKKNDQKHLPIYGVGPLYGSIIILMSAISVILSGNRILYIGIPQYLDTLFIVIGSLLIMLGIYIWVRAVLIDKLDNSIKKNKLLTTGIYAWVRNPVYTAITFVCIGILFFGKDLWLLALPFLFWLILTILMIYTEEKWLKELYGKEYEEYCEHVNRCIPWFPRNR